MYHQEPRARAHGADFLSLVWTRTNAGVETVSYLRWAALFSFFFSDLLMQASSRARRDYCFRERESGGRDRTRGKSNLPSEGSFVRAREVQRMIRGELERRPQ